MRSHHLIRRATVIFGVGTYRINHSNHCISIGFLSIVTVILYRLGGIPLVTTGRKWRLLHEIDIPAAGAVTAQHRSQNDPQTYQNVALVLPDGFHMLPRHIGSDPGGGDPSLNILIADA